MGDTGDYFLDFKLPKWGMNSTNEFESIQEDIAAMYGWFNCSRHLMRIQFVDFATILYPHF